MDQMDERLCPPERPRRNSSLGKRDGGSWGEKRSYGTSPSEMSLATMVLNCANANAATEARREATLGQMRCLAALAEWQGRMVYSHHIYMVYRYAKHTGPIVYSSHHI